MSRVFSDTTNNNGLVQKYEEEIGVNFGDVSNDTTRLQKFTSATRSAWDRYLYLAFKGSGEWQYDDSNHGDYPIIKTNIASGRQDYTVTTDENNNLILDIFKVAILRSATDTVYEEISLTDAQGHTTDLNYDLVAESGDTGVPYAYDKTANGIFLNPTPSYNATNGLKIYINREPSYFTTSDTTKKPGCPGNHHDYFYLRPALEHARRNNNANYNRLLEEVIKYEGDEETGRIGMIQRDFGQRNRDKRPKLTMKSIKYI